MKTTTKTNFFIVLIALAVAFGWWLFNQKKQPAPITRTSKPVPTAPGATTSPPIQSNTPPEILQPYARTRYLGLKDPRWIERRRLREQDSAYQWRTPIAFYGKVVDEQHQPVAGAEIEYSWNGTIEKYGGDGVVHRTMSSDSNGSFHIQGIEGKILTVLVSKNGYYRRKTWNGGSFDYAAFWEPIFIEPDHNNPVTFHLVKRPVGEPTLRVRQRSIATAPSWTKHLDLLAQPSETTAGGDFALRIVRPPNPGYQNPFDWELIIEGGGGAEFIESNEEFMLRAPDEGYQKTLSRSFKKARGNSIETIKFYVRNKARRLYAAVSVEITPYYPNHVTKEDGACFIVTGTVNPNDSPNVEYDPEKDIREMAKK